MCLVSVHVDGIRLTRSSADGHMKCQPGGSKWGLFLFKMPFCCLSSQFFLEDAQHCPLSDLRIQLIAGPPTRAAFTTHRDQPFRTLPHQTQHVPPLPRHQHLRSGPPPQILVLARLDTRPARHHVRLVDLPVTRREPNMEQGRRFKRQGVPLSTTAADSNLKSEIWPVGSWVKLSHLCKDKGLHTAIT